MTTTVKTDRRQEVAAAAYRIRHHVLNMGEAQGQGYVGQALGAADMLAAVYADQLRYRADDPHWDGRDRFLLSTGHYAIGLYAALAEAGIIPVDELDTYGSDDSRLPMSGMATYTPGMEISGGSLGHGLTVAVGMALGLRLPGLAGPGLQLPLRRRTRRGLDLGSRDGRQPSPARQPDRAGRHQRPAGRRTHRRGAAHRAVADKWEACGWFVRRVDGNDVDALLAAFDDVAGQAAAGRAAVGHPVRHPGRPRRAAAGEPGRRRTSCASTTTNGRLCRDQLTAGYKESEQP